MSAKTREAIAKREKKSRQSGRKVVLPKVEKKKEAAK